MNDRSVSLLDNYDIEVLQTWKGRGAVLCETNQGTLILKEYPGHREKSEFQDRLLQKVQENGFCNVESIVRNKEGELLTVDQDGTAYILKTYFEGRECNVRDLEECSFAIETLARYHKAAEKVTAPSFSGGSYTVSQEFGKHNKELRRVRKFLKEKGQKNDFEIYLLQCYDYFFELALRITDSMLQYESSTDKIQSGVICHGDFQHHNLIFVGKELNMINFEKCVPDSPVRDIYLFMRKLLEKSNWAEELGFELLSAYDRERELEQEDYVQLYYRLAYPEKFWKIVNFYYNSGKAWIPGKNLEKLQKVHMQEKEKNKFLQNFKKKYDILYV